MEWVRRNTAKLTLLAGLITLIAAVGAAHGCYGGCNNYIDTFNFERDGGNGQDTYLEYYGSCVKSGGNDGRNYNGWGCYDTCSNTDADRFQFRDNDGNYGNEYCSGNNCGTHIWTSNYGWMNPGETLDVRFHCTTGETSGWDTRELPAYPNIDSISYNDASNDHAFTVRAVVSDNNGDGDLNACDLTVDDGEGFSQSYNMNINRGYGNGNEARCTQRVDYQDSGGWSMDENMNIQVSVQDNDKGWSDSASGSHSFPNRRPDNPSNPAPNNGEVGVQTSPTLAVDVADQDGDSMDVTFRNADNDNLIGSVSGVGDGSRPDVTWSNLNPGTEYSWYVEADDGSLTQTSPTWSFTTSYSPTVDDLTISPVSDAHAFTTDVMFSDPDGDDDIVSCEREVTDGSTTQTYNGQVDRTAGGPDQAACVFDNPVRSSDNGGWSHTSQMTIIVRATDEVGNTGQTTALQSFPNHVPSTQTGPIFNDVSDAHAFDVTATATDPDGYTDGQGLTEFDQCTIIHENGQKTGTLTVAPDDSTASGNSATCTGTISTADGYEVHEEVDVSVRFTDVHGDSDPTVQQTHEIPNRPPAYNAETRFPPNLPPANSNTYLRMNMSDAEGDPITWANFTIWEYNSAEGVVRQEFANDPGTLYERGNYWLINSSAIFTDLSGASYNVSLTVSDGYDTRTLEYPFTQSGSETWFTLQDVRPNVTEPAMFRAAPYELNASTFRPGQSLTARFKVRDLNGRANLDQYDIRITNNNGYTETVEGIERLNQVGNGYNMSIFHNLDGSIPEGDYEFVVTATDEQGLSTTNRTDFEVVAYDDVTTTLTYPESQESVYIDGAEVTGTDTTRDASAVTFPYVVETNGTVMSGLIDYGQFQELSYEDNSGSTVMEISQDLQNNNILLPMAAADTGDLSQLQSEFTGGIFSGTGFLDYASSSLAFGVSEEKTVRVEAQFDDEEDIFLRGFNGTLGTGTFELAVRNAGMEDGMTVIEVNR